MKKRTIDYDYPPPARSRRGFQAGLTMYQCVNCGRYGARPVDPGRFKCWFCKSIVEYVVLEDDDSHDPDAEV